MMLHRHFEQEENKRKHMTKQEDVSPNAFVSEVFPPDDTVEAPKEKRGRQKKSAE